MSVVPVAVALTLAAAPQGPGDDHEGHTHLGEVVAGPIGTPLTANRNVDWRTPTVSCDPGCPSFSYTIEVADDVAGNTVQFAIDDRWNYDGAVLEVVTPDGTTLTDRTGGDLEYQLISAVVTEEDAKPGRYAVTVRFTDVNDGFARVRAMTVPSRALEGTLLPNLRAMPPFDFTFTASVASNTPLGGGLVGLTFATNYGMAAGGQRLQSCTPDEQQVALDPTQPGQKGPLLRCLRFSAGPENIGEGHLDLRFTPPVSTGSDGLFPMYQHLHDANGGETTVRPAGSYVFHPTHTHYHHAEMAVYDLLAVDDDQLTLVSGGVKTGFCPLDLGIADWDSPHHAQRGTVQRLQGTDCYGLNGGAMGISAGWVDIYDRQFSGQFVDFSFQPDGLYIVRVTIDRDGLILESDESDNVSYALIEVVGDEITVIERGYGSDHLDPAKAVATDGRTTHPLFDLLDLDLLP